MLFSHPGGMPDTGHSGRANNYEDISDPYGGSDVPGPYGYADDPYDGDWALGPLGGKGLRTQNLRFTNGFQNRRPAAPARKVQSRGAPQQEEANVWGAEPMGTDSLFMPRLTASDIKHGQQEHDAMVKKQMAKFGGKAPPKTPDWVGTNQAFFGAHQGGDSSFTHQPAQAKRSHFKRAQQKNQPRKMKGARTQQLFRSDDPHLAEYGFEGDNQLNEDVLPSDIGSGGPVIGVDGEPSNVDHAWVHVEEPFSFSCSPDILGCEEGLEVDPDYANDLKGVDYQ